METENNQTTTDEQSLSANNVSQATATTASATSNLTTTTTNPNVPSTTPAITLTEKDYKNPFCKEYINLDPYEYRAKDFDYISPPPIEGKVRPLYIPPEEKPHRNTNQLQFLLKSLHKAVVKHKHAWPFDSPVDTKSLKLPEYFTIITKPMDFSAIKKRLENYWYYDAIECIADFKQVFVNCYKYNRPTDDVVMMAREVEKALLDKLEEMPIEEQVIEIPQKAKGKGKKGGRRITGGSVTSTTSALRHSQATSINNNNINNNNALMQINKLSALNIDNSSNHSHMDSISPAFSNSTNQSTFQHYNNQDSQSANHSTNAQNTTTFERNSILSKNLPNIFNSTSEAAVIDQNSQSNNLVPIHLTNHTDIANHSSSSNPAHDQTSPQTALVSSQHQNSSQTDQNTLRPLKMSTRRESGRPIKKPQRDLPEVASNVVPSRPKKAKMTERMKYCQGILRELLHKKHLDIAFFFYDPVDAEKLNLKDYHDIIKEPMDLSTIKKKMDGREYRKPDQFARDVRLMFTNSFRYNPPEHVVNKAGRKLSEIFEQKYANIPDGSDDTESDEASNVPSSESESESEGESDSENLANIAKRLENSFKRISEEFARFMEQVRNYNARKKSGKTKRSRQLRYKDSSTKRSSNPIAVAGTSGASNDYNMFTGGAVANAEGIGKGKLKGSQKRSVSSRSQQPIKKLRTNSKLNQKQAGAPRTHDDSDDDENEVIMTYNEKRELSLNINKLPSKFFHLGIFRIMIVSIIDLSCILINFFTIVSYFAIGDKLGKVVQIIQQREPSLRDSNPDEIEIDFETLKNSTLRELEKYVAECLKKKRGPKPNKNRLMSRLGKDDPVAARSNVDKKEDPSQMGKPKSKKGMYLWLCLVEQRGIVTIKFFDGCMKHIGYIAVANMIVCQGCTQLIVNVTHSSVMAHNCTNALVLHQCVNTTKFISMYIILITYLQILIHFQIRRIHMLRTIPTA